MHGICSLECGRQVFWIVLLAVMEAVTLRSLLSGWIVEDIPALQVVFAHLDDHSPCSLALHDAWSARFGMEIGTRLDTSPSIFDRLGRPDLHARPILLLPGPPPIAQFFVS